MIDIIYALMSNKHGKQYYFPFLKCVKIAEYYGEQSLQYVAIFMVKSALGFGYFLRFQRTIEQLSQCSVADYTWMPHELQPLAAEEDEDEIQTSRPSKTFFLKLKKQLP